MQLSAPTESIDHALVENRATSLAHLFRDRVRRSANQEAFRYFRDGEWKSVTWTQTREQADLWAAGLIALGVAPQDRVAIAATTRYEWVVADLAIMSAGAAMACLELDISRKPFSPQACPHELTSSPLVSSMCRTFTTAWPLAP